VLPHLTCGDSAHRTVENGRNLRSPNQDHREDRALIEHHRPWGLSSSRDLRGNILETLTCWASIATAPFGHEVPICPIVDPIGGKRHVAGMAAAISGRRGGRSRRLDETLRSMVAAVVEPRLADECLVYGTQHNLRMTSALGSSTTCTRFVSNSADDRLGQAFHQVRREGNCLNDWRQSTTVRRSGR